MLHASPVPVHAVRRPQSRATAGRATIDRAELYLILTRLSPGLVVVRHPRFGRQMWALAALRQATTCRVTGRPLAPGELAWRPMSNRGNRSHRLAREVLALPIVPPAPESRPVWTDEPQD